MSRQKFSFRPKLLDCLKTYSKDDFWHDLTSGITVGIIALPLAMAFAIASGLTPEAGIFTAIIAGFLISTLGGSKVQIGGPAGAFIVVVYGIVAQHGVDGLIIATLMAGVLLFLMGFFRMGSLVRFVPISIVIGFTNGIAILIALSQIKDLLGLDIKDMPSDFFPQISTLAANIDTFNTTTIALSIASLLIVFLWPKFTAKFGNAFIQKIPGTIIALVGGTAAVYFMALPVETIGTRFGGIPSGLPHITFPEISFTTIQHLITPALTIALLGAIESLLCARVADGIIDDRHNPNQELMAQGIANFTAPLFGGFCATGTIARTVTNARSGARTPIAGIIHAATLLAIILLAAPLAKNIPLATLGAILIFVAYNMGEWHEFGRMKNFTNNYRIILMSTFLLTIILDLTVAVEVGLILACLFFITRVSTLTKLEPIPQIEAEGHAKIGADIEAYRLSGSLFFGAVHKLEEITDPSRVQPKVIVLSLDGLLNMDTSGLEALEGVYKALKKKRCTLLIAGARGQALSLMTRSGFNKRFGETHLFETTALALTKAAELTGQTEEADVEA